MSLHHDMAAASRTAHNHYFASQVTITRPGAAQELVNAVLGKVRTETRTDERGRAQRVSVRRCRFTELEELRHDTLVTAEGVDYSIEQVLRSTTSGLYVELRSMRTHEVSRQDYRVSRQDYRGRA